MSDAPTGQPDRDSRRVTEPDAGRSTGEVLTPLGLMVPTNALPPKMPFTLQFTAVFVVLVMVGTKVCWVPSSAETDSGVRLTVMP
jgi:hypothetical protein